MAQQKRVRPSYYDEEDYSDDELSYALNKQEKEDSSDDELSKMSFETLNKAQSKLQRQLKEEEDGEEEGFFDSDSDSDAPPEETTSKSSIKGKKNKHAPSESSSKKPVSRIRDIPGLPTRKSNTLHTDIRFDAAYGKADLNRIRKDYAFLDDYRNEEIKRMETILKDKKSKLNEYEKDELRLKFQSLKSRMDTLKNRDLESKILSEYKKKNTNGDKPFFIKRADKRKILQKAKFDSMKPKQREKVMERKRKKRLGKEFRQLEFKPTNR
ncbi:unnamed protein product [Candida verbasci]|uniref:rRNA biogenesis protein RRP36 n=1 Tax=Candida verbasci TaxID=1227364 RepID=A0A9W4TQ54_9ASCO|nr:unnamed protein product [Candida verbasci]